MRLTWDPRARQYYYPWLDGGKAGMPCIDAQLHQRLAYRSQGSNLTFPPRLVLANWHGLSREASRQLKHDEPRTIN